VRSCLLDVVQQGEVTIEQAGQQPQPQGGAGPGLLGFPPHRLTGGVDIAAVVAAVQADEDVVFLRALAAVAADIGRRGNKVVVNPPGDEGTSPVDLMLAQRRDDVPLGASEDIHEGLRRIGLHLKVESVPGWTKGELFRVPPVWARGDLCGVGLLIGDREVVEVKPAEIRIKTASGATLAFYRKPEVDYRVAYEAHLRATRGNYKSDSEEAHLRAVEAAVDLFRSNNPNASLEDAKRAVLALLKL
jgi:hypothetical protein